MSMTKLAEVTVGAGGQSSINFTNIPQTFTDLVVSYSLRSNRSGANLDALKMTFNGNTANYSVRTLIGFGSGSGYSENVSGQSSLDSYGLNASTAVANTFASGQAHIPNYASAANKSVSMDWCTEDNVTSAWNGVSAGLWANTSAITSISFAPMYGTLFTQYSTATLYGVSKVPAAGIQAKATGGDIYQNGAYTYHVFRSSGTFTPTTAIPNAEYVIIGAGGPGGGTGGGGGAGGYRSSIQGELSGGGAPAESRISLNSGTPYTVTVGAGGTANNTNGNNSSFNSIISLGGGAGGNGPGGGLTGGSGGATGGNPASAGGSGTAGQGYAAGFAGSYAYPSDSGAGGGGAGGVGSASSPGVGGTGGVGVQSNITGSPTYYAGGGGGWSRNGNGGISGGNGGGGRGASGNSNSTAGTANTGGGGGAFAGGSDVGANGGSGIVIIRYA